jgi:hypothetical protein
VLWASGDGDGAAVALRHAIDLYHTVGDFHGEVWSTAGLARMEADRSADDGVVALYRKLLEMESRLGDRMIGVYTQANYADLLRERGQLGDARTVCAQAEKSDVFKDYPAFRGSIRLICAGVVRDRGDVASASSLLKQESGNANDDSEGSLGVLATVIPLARIEIGRRQWAKARDLLKPWVTVIATGKQESTRTTVGAEADALIALCYQRLGDSVARDRATAQATNLRQRITEHRSGFDVDLALARLQGETGKRAVGVAKLQALATDADKRYWMASALEARLAVYRLLAQGHDPAAAALHDKIAATAKSHGFKWVLARLDAPTSSAALAATPH